MPNLHHDIKNFSYLQRPLPEHFLLENKFQLHAIKQVSTSWKNSYMEYVHILVTNKKS